ncbi:GCK domain-containing protein, partial [Haematococcus lacustris]
SLVGKACLCCCQRLVYQAGSAHRKGTVQYTGVLVAVERSSDRCACGYPQVWLKCVDDVRDAGRDDVESCAGLMGPLWDCMQHNSAYYSPQLDSLASRKPGEVQLQLSPKDRGPKDS